jgi:hypothetical protein
MKRKEEEHWDTIYRTNKEQEVSWFQPYPKTSIGFIELFNLPLDANIIDVGGGARTANMVSAHLGLDE